MRSIRESYERYRAAVRAARDPRKVASERFQTARRNGVVALYPACESCGSADRLQGHHPSYATDMRLCVVTLCASCHRRLHRECRAWLDTMAASEAA